MCKTKLDEVMKWLETAEHAEVEESASMQSDLESVCHPIMQQLNSSGGGGMPSQSLTPPETQEGGPTIEKSKLIHYFNMVSGVTNEPLPCGLLLQDHGSFRHRLQVLHALRSETSRLPCFGFRREIDLHHDLQTLQIQGHSSRLQQEGSESDLETTAS